MPDKTLLAQHLIGDIAPKLADITDDVLFGDVWERPGLKKRDRSLITVAALMAMNRLEQLPFHIGFALDNGVTPRRNRRRDHTAGVLFRLADGDVRIGDREESFRREVLRNARLVTRGHT